MKVFQSLVISEGVPLLLDVRVKSRFTCKSHIEAVLTALETAEELEDCREMVRESGCKVDPEGPKGPKFFVPASVRDLRKDLADVGVELQGHHVLIRECDMWKLEAVLRKLPKKHRPGLHPRVLAAAADEPQIEGEDQEFFVMENAFERTDSDLYTLD